jgi:hypothetical protein
MICEYVAPTKWYRREIAWHIKIVLWPDWLARRLCNHQAAEPWIAKFPDCALSCPDCGVMVNLVSQTDLAKTEGK